MDSGVYVYIYIYGSGRSIFWSTIPASSWRSLGHPRKISAAQTLASSDWNLFHFQCELYQQCRKDLWYFLGISGDYGNQQKRCQYSPMALIRTGHLMNTGFTPRCDLTDGMWRFAEWYCGGSRGWIKRKQFHWIINSIMQSIKSYLLFEIILLSDLPEILFIPEILNNFQQKHGTNCYKFFSFLSSFISIMLRSLQS
jgi:hypothetical protein